jgi:hypothetical protein
MFAGKGFVDDVIDNTVGRIPGVGDVIGGVSDFVFGDDPTPAGGKIGQGALNSLYGIYNQRLQGAPQFQWFQPGQRIGFQQQPTISNQFIDQLGRPTLRFGQRSPFQFNFANAYNPRQAVGDAFTPELTRAQQALEISGQRERENILNDLNQRGLTQTGVVTDAMLRQQESQRNTAF